MSSLYRSHFKDMMNEVVAAGRCTACGSCVTVCPHNVIEYVDGKPKQTARESAPFDYCGVSEGVGCDVCAAVCPRLWPGESHLRNAVFGDDRGYEAIFGVYKHIFVARTRHMDTLARAQDGGIVTGLLAWARQTGHIDGAIVAAVGEDDRPCFPTPKLATTLEQIRESAGSWYTYCPNNLALEQAREQGLERLAFVGVPCQITPLRKMECMDPSLLVAVGKKAQVIRRQRNFLRGHAGRVAFSVGLFCTEVFRPELMTEHVQQHMGIPLSDVAKVNVKGEVRIYRKSGDIERISLEDAMSDYQRPECRYCGDFSAELADMSCGGVGTEGASIVVLRTSKAVELWRAFEASGAVDVWPIADNKKAWNILQRLARQQRERVTGGTGRAGSGSGLQQYSARQEADLAADLLAQAGVPAGHIDACLAEAYGDEARAGQDYHEVGAPIPGDPGEPADGEKRKLPPPPTSEQGGSSPLMELQALV